MATTVEYNELILHNVNTRRWEQEVVYDDSDIDRVSTRYSLEFEGIITYPYTEENPKPDGDATSSLPTWIGTQNSLGAGPTTPHLYREIRWRLCEPRKKLIVRMGVTPADQSGQIVLNVSPFAVTFAGEAEVGGGPHPVDVQITHIAHNKVFRVVFVIKCEITECDTSLIPDILSNKWSVAETMDANWFRVRTITGRLRLAKPRAARVNMRDKLVVPSDLERGFRRESIQYTADPSGYAADYVVVDKQVHAAAPWPATKMETTFKDETGNGIIWYQEASVVLQGPPNANKKLLLARAFQIIEWRLEVKNAKINPGDNDAAYLLDRCSITEQHGEQNTVAVNMRIQKMLPPGNDVAGKPFKAGFHMNALATRISGRQLGAAPQFNILPGEGVAYHSAISNVPPPLGVNPYSGVRKNDAVEELEAKFQDACNTDDKHELKGKQSLLPP